VYRKTMATELLGNTQTATYTYMTAPRLNGLSTPSFLPSISARSTASAKPYDTYPHPATTPTLTWDDTYPHLGRHLPSPVDDTYPHLPDPGDATVTTDRRSDGDGDTYPHPGTTPTLTLGRHLPSPWDDTYPHLATTPTLTRRLSVAL